MKRSLWIRWPIIFCLSLVSCHESKREEPTPEIAGPCPGPGEAWEGRPVALWLDEDGNAVGQAWMVVR